MSGKETDVFAFQRRILQLFGVLPLKLSTLCKVWSTLFLFLLIVILLGGWLTAAVQFAQAIMVYFENGDPQPTPNYMINAICYAAYPALTLRGVLMLSVFYAKRTECMRLFYDVGEIVQTGSMFESSQFARTKKWRLVGIGLTVFTIFSQVWTDALAFYFLFGPNPAGLTANNAFDPIPAPVNGWQLILIIQFFSSLPNVLSQQFLVILVVCSVILQDRIAGVNRSIDKNTQRANFAVSHQGTPVHSRMHSRGSVDLSQLETLEEEISGAMHLHSKVVAVNETVNHVFGTMFALAFCLDIVSVVGFLAGLVLNPKIQQLNVLEYLLPICLLVKLLPNLTLFQLPHIRLHETGLMINKKLCKFADAAVSLLQLEEGRRLNILLEIFLQKSRDELIVIQGLHLLYVTRHLLITTVALPLSLLVIVFELSHRPEVLSVTAGNASTHG